MKKEPIIRFVEKRDLQELIVLGLNPLSIRLLQGNTFVCDCAESELKLLHILLK